MERNTAYLTGAVKYNWGLTKKVDYNLVELEVRKVS